MNRRTPNSLTHGCLLLAGMLAALVGLAQGDVASRWAKALARTAHLERRDIEPRCPLCKRAEMQRRLTALARVSSGCRCECPKLLEYDRWQTGWHWTHPESAARSYEAALELDDHCLLAWYWLAMNTKAEARRYDALAAIRRLDPENGLGYYLLAMEFADADDVTGALREVVAGNSHSVKMPICPAPGARDLDWPAESRGSPAESAEGTSSADNPRMGAAYIAHAAMLTHYTPFEDLGKRLLAYSEELLQTGKKVEARECLVAIFGYGLGLAEGSGHDSLLALVGLGIADTAIPDLRVVYRTGGDRERLAWVEQWERARESVRGAYRSYLYTVPEVSTPESEWREGEFVIGLIERTGVGELDLGE